MTTTYSLREAAELCDTTLKAMRNRADRGGLQTVLLDGERRVPHSELERAGLLPDAELHQLRGQVDKLTRELAAQRQLVVSVERDREAERQAHQLTEQALLQQRASATTARAQAGTATQALQALEADLLGAGPLKAWKLARTRRKAADAAHADSLG